MTPRTLAERLATALATDDLLLREAACDLDKIIVSGWSAKTRELGSLAFWSKYLNDGYKARQLADTVRRMAVSRMRQQRRMARREEIHRLADIVVAWWLHDKCPTCQGRGLLVLRDQQVVSNIECGSCHGSGLRRLPTPDEAGLDWEEALFVRRFTDVQLVIDGAMGSYMGGVSRALRQRIEGRDEQPAERAVLVRTHDDGID